MELFSKDICIYVLVVQFGENPEDLKELTKEQLNNMVNYYDVSRNGLPKDLVLEEPSKPSKRRVV